MAVSGLRPKGQRIKIGVGGGGGVGQAVKLERARNERGGVDVCTYMRDKIMHQMAMKSGGRGEPYPPIAYAFDHTKQANICNGAFQLQLRSAYPRKSIS